MPITFGIRYPAGRLLAPPAVWLTTLLLPTTYPSIIEAAELSGVEMMVRTQFGEDGGVIMTAAKACKQIALEIDTRLISHSVEFYAALLMASNL